MTSILSLVLCCAMLIGTTFAWFTDSVTSGKNKITAGNLDVKLEYKQPLVGDDGTVIYADWADVDENTSVFLPSSETLWEPGHMEVAYLKVSNVGTLALQYQLSINAIDTVTSTSVLGNEIALSKYLEYAVIPLESDTVYDSREEVRTALSSVTSVKLTDVFSSGDKVLYPENNKPTDGVSEQYVALVVYMPEIVGNEANYDKASGQLAPEVDLGIVLNATQTPYEEDSFDDQYDKYAPYPDATLVKTVDEFTKAVSEAEDGDVIALAENVQLSAPMTIKKNITIYGNGNLIEGYPITANADVTFENVKFSKPVNANNNATLVYAQAGCEELVLDGCTFSDPQWEAIQATSSDLKSLTVTNCTFTAANVEGAASSYGNTVDQAIRYIHIQPKQTPTVAVTITNNVFKNCDKVKDSIVGIYYVSTDSTITVGGNTFEGWAEGDVTDGVTPKLSVGWPEVETLKTIANWQGEPTTYKIDKNAN